MAIKTGEAALTFTSSMIPITGFLPFEQGILDPVSGTIKAIGRGRWGSLSGSSWTRFTSYVNVFEKIKWSSTRIDTGEIDYFNLAINSVANGTLSYRVYVSDTGDFQGEESEYFIQDGNNNVSAFYGRFVYVTAECTGTELSQMVITTDKEVVEYSFKNVNTSTLGGSVSERILTLTNPVSIITEMAIHPRAATAYAVNLYVSNTATSQVLIPVVKSKTGTTPSFVMYGIDNDPRDGIVDITIKALPRQVMAGGNLLVIK
jgi:hypothetical protein